MADYCGNSNNNSNNNNNNNNNTTTNNNNNNNQADCACATTTNSNGGGCELSDHDHDVNLDFKIIIEKFDGLLKCNNNKSNNNRSSSKCRPSNQQQQASGGADSDDLDEDLIAKSSIDLVQNELTDLCECLKKNEKELCAYDESIQKLEKELKDLQAKRMKCQTKNRKIKELMKLKCYLLNSAKKAGQKPEDLCCKNNVECDDSIVSSVNLLASKNSSDQKKAIEQLKDKLCESNCDGQTKEKLTKQAVETNVARQLVCLLSLDLEFDYLIDMLNILIQLATISNEVRRLLDKPDCMEHICCLKRKYLKEIHALQQQQQHNNHMMDRCQPNPTLLRMQKRNNILNEKTDTLIKLIKSENNCCC